MKKNVVIASIILLTVVVFSACKTHERCPAYGSSPKPQSAKIVKV